MISTVNLPQHIVYRYRRLKDIDLDEGTSLLSEREHIYLDSVRHEKRRREFTAGRILARLEAASLLDTPPEDVALEVADDGALELSGTEFSISLAHTQEGVCTAIARGSRVGIDLEIIKPRHPNLHRFILNPEEYRLLDTLPIARDQALILCWALKEATLKGMRTGFRCSPKKLLLDIDASESKAKIAVVGGQVWNAQFELHDHAYLAISYPQQPSSEII